MFKKISFISLLFFYPNIYASHEPCIAIYPTPPECLHNQDDDSDNNILIASAVVAGVYFYLSKDKDPDSFNINNGLTLYEGKKVKASFLSNRFYQQSEEIYQSPAIHPLNDLEDYKKYNILSIDLSPWTKSH
ncbi:MAG: hypothetical protein VW146_03755 [Gammaproteobacteria bacterium]